MIPNSLTIQIDTREQYPLQFPDSITVPNIGNSYKKIKILKQQIKLDAGDYRLAQAPTFCIIERKASQAELVKNLFHSKDSIRTGKAFALLQQACLYPTLLIEGTPASLTRNKKLIRHPEEIFHRLGILTVQYGLHVIWAGNTHSSATRRELGRYLLHHMYAVAQYHNEELEAIGA
jgi:ERCC4-type nuclease